MPILNNFPGGSGLDTDVSETTLTPENARAGYSFFNASEKFVAGEIPDYTGVTAVTPSSMDQVLPTAGKFVPSDITVDAIPSAFYRVQVGTAHVADTSGAIVDDFPITFTFEENLEFNSIEDVGICWWWCGNDDASDACGGYVITYAWSGVGFSEFSYSSIQNYTSKPRTYTWSFSEGTSIVYSGKTLYLNRPSSASGRFMLNGDYVCLVYYPR